MISLLMGFGLGKRAAQAIAYIAVPVLVVGALWLALHLYGNSRYRAGARDTDAKWEEASRRLKEQAAQSATHADDQAAQRLEEFEQQVQEERQAIDAAIQNGSSPFDVLFGP